jgi:hypothetical protein
MPSFSGCRVTVEDDGGRPLCEDDDADLQLDGARLLLTYWDERGAVVLVGDASPAQTGRYERTARSRPRRATLASDGARAFAGTWVEGDEQGRLRVELPAAAGSEALR